MPEAQPDWSANKQHPVVATDDDFKDSGKDVSKIDPPIVSINDSSDEPAEMPKKEFEVFDNANRYLNHVGVKHDFAYPFEAMTIGQGFFVPVEPNSTMDKLIAHMHRAIGAFHKQTAVQEKDEHGDDVLESVTVLTKKRTPDGYIQLDGLSNPIVGATGGNRPKQIRVADFIVKSVIKGDEIAEGREAKSDGALVIRVA